MQDKIQAWIQIPTDMKQVPGQVGSLMWVWIVILHRLPLVVMVVLARTVKEMDTSITLRLLGLQIRFQLKLPMTLQMLLSVQHNVAAGQDIASMLE
jgi:hypothetical protein